MILTFDLWPWLFAWTSLLSMVITPENRMVMRWGEHGEKVVMGGRTDKQTDWTIHGAARSQLKTINPSPSNKASARISNPNKYVCFVYSWKCYKMHWYHSSVRKSIDGAWENNRLSPHHRCHWLSNWQPQRFGPLQDRHRDSPCVTVHMPFNDR